MKKQFELTDLLGSYGSLLVAGVCLGLVTGDWKHALAMSVYAACVITAFFFIWGKKAAK